MKKLATAIVAIALIGTPAFAADMAIKAPPSPPPAPVYNWTGWYVGGNVGASMGNVNTDFNVSPIAVGGSTNFFTEGRTITNTTAPSGFIGGGQIGYNWQYSPLIVVGLEADIQGALERETDRLDNQLTGFPSFPGDTLTNYTTQIDWFGTVRARLGYVWGNGGVLSYVTGGLAYGEVKIQGTSTTSFVGQPLAVQVSQAFSASHLNTGWTLGYGTEGKLLIPGWTYKIESLYMDLGHLSATGVTTGIFEDPLTNGPVHGGQVTTNSMHFTDWILRAGLNYQFH
jgi:outer membrane immunogenic protein